MLAAPVHFAEEHMIGALSLHISPKVSPFSYLGFFVVAAGTI
jgi:hypothetical protein